MAFTDTDLWRWLSLAQNELLLFAGVFFLLGALDDLAVDCTWLWLRISRRIRTQVVDRAALETRELDGMAAVLIPAWREDQVIADTIRHTLSAWPQQALRLYVGCYHNDPLTIERVVTAAPRDTRLRVVINERAGPTTKADCLNRLYLALHHDEQRSAARFKMIVIHDAEDMVDPAALGLMDQTIGEADSGAADFVQLPVEPIPQHGRHWLGSHYCEEFAEDHAKAMVVRDALAVGIPSAGVGCALSRRALDHLLETRSDGLPFASEALTEDYELGLAIGEMGGVCRFIRAKDRTGKLIATRAYFPSSLGQIVRQKSRWIHGIALQGWDRVGWSGRAAENWMRLRDRRGPFAAAVLLAGYAFVALAVFNLAANWLGFAPVLALSTAAIWLVGANLAAFGWRAAWRFCTTANAYGYRQAIGAVLRIPFANVIAIMSARRAVTQYARSLLGAEVTWEKTAHRVHPATRSLALDLRL